MKSKKRHAVNNAVLVKSDALRPMRPHGIRGAHGSQEPSLIGKGKGKRKGNGKCINPNFKKKNARLCPFFYLFFWGPIFLLLTPSDSTDDGVPCGEACSLLGQLKEQPPAFEGFHKRWQMFVNGDGLVTMVRQPLGQT